MRRAPVVLLAVLSIIAVLPALPRTDQGPSSYLGFDLNEYPGDDALPALRKTFSFTGYWLSPPPGKNTTIGPASGPCCNRKVLVSSYFSAVRKAAI